MSLCCLLLRCLKSFEPFCIGMFGLGHLYLLLRFGSWSCLGNRFLTILRLRNIFGFLRACSPLGSFRIWFGKGFCSSFWRVRLIVVGTVQRDFHFHLRCMSRIFWYRKPVPQGRKVKGKTVCAQLTETI